MDFEVEICLVHDLEMILKAVVVVEQVEQDLIQVVLSQVTVV